MIYAYPAVLAANRTVTIHRSTISSITAGKQRIADAAPTPVIRLGQATRFDDSNSKGAIGDPGGIPHTGRSSL